MNEYGISTDKDGNWYVDDTHQRILDTNDEYVPRLTKFMVGGYQAYSVFERKKAEEIGVTANQIIYFFKNDSTRQQAYPSSEEEKNTLYRRVTLAMRALPNQYSTFILMSSSSGLNSKLMDLIRAGLPNKVYYEGVFSKRLASDIKKMFIEGPIYERLMATPQGIIQAKKILNGLDKMISQRGNVFRYHDIGKNNLRQFLPSPFVVDSSEVNSEDINGKDIIIVDDTVTTGVSLTNAAEAILETYEPSSIAFLTMFSSLEGKDI